MASEPKTKRVAQERDDLARPSKWRLQHGGFSEPVRGADPETGLPVAHRRAVDTLGAMLANGTITPAMHDAGAIFRGRFRTAALDTLRAMPMVRVPSGNGGPITERQVGARREVAAALEALGGHNSAAGSCAWHVLGCGCSIREWASRRGWSGRPVGHAQAQGILVAALGVLAAHFRLRAPGGAQDRPA
jgi:hypothetical protein